MGLSVHLVFKGIDIPPYRPLGAGRAELPVIQDCQNKGKEEM
jgi:hypothetical protein